MPEYVKKVLAQFKHMFPGKLQYSPYQPPPRKYETKSQETLPRDTTAKANAEQIKIVQWVIGGVLYYAHVVDCTVLASLSNIASA